MYMEEMEYQAGDITYKSTPNQSRYNFDLIYDHEKNQTMNYDKRICTVRRGSNLKMILTTQDSKFDELEHYNLFIFTRSNHEPIKIRFVNDSDKHYGIDYCIKMDNSKLTIEVDFSVEAPIGFYYLAIFEKDVTVANQTVQVVFNPFNNNDAVYHEEENFKNQYLLNDAVKISTLEQRMNKRITYKLSAFEHATKIILWSPLDDMDINSRNDPIKVVRYISSWINDEKIGLIKVCEESVMESCHNSWESAKDIYEKLFKTTKPLASANSVIYSMILTSLFRNLGIPTRVISGYNIVFDYNEDGNITAILKQNKEVIFQNDEKIINLHTWNNVWIKRPNDEAGEKYCWEHIDATPRQYISGLKNCLGPYPVKYIKSDADTSLHDYDGAIIRNSLKAAVKYILVDDSNVEKGEVEVFTTANLMISTTVDGHQDYMRHEYI